MDKSLVLKEIAEKQRQLDILIAVEEVVANEPKPFNYFMCCVASEIARKEAIKIHGNGYFSGQEAYVTAGKDFLNFILSTQGSDYKKETHPNITPFDVAIAADYREKACCYDHTLVDLFKAVWIDFMILVLEDEILELLEDESL